MALEELRVVRAVVELVVELLQLLREGRSARSSPWRGPRPRSRTCPPPLPSPPSRAGWVRGRWAAAAPPRRCARRCARRRCRPLRQNFLRSFRHPYASSPNRYSPPSSPPSADMTLWMTGAKTVLLRSTRRSRLTKSKNVFWVLVQSGQVEFQIRFPVDGSYFFIIRGNRDNIVFRHCERRFRRSWTALLVLVDNMSVTRRVTSRVSTSRMFLYLFDS